MHRAWINNHNARECFTHSPATNSPICIKCFSLSSSTFRLCFSFPSFFCFFCTWKTNGLSQYDIRNEIRSLAFVVIIIRVHVMSIWFHRPRGRTAAPRPKRNSTARYEIGRQCNTEMHCGGCCCLFDGRPCQWKCTYSGLAWACATVIVAAAACYAVV